MPPDKIPTSDQLRANIDSGADQDKVDYPDPAAVPLGADDEAAGHPPSPSERVRAVRSTQRPQSLLGSYSGMKPAVAVAIALAVLIAVALTFLYL